MVCFSFVFAVTAASSVLTLREPSLLDSVDKWVGLITSIVTAVGIIGGGLWAFFNFAQQRKYRQKLEANITGHVRCIGNATYLLIEYQIKSIGYPKTTISKKSGILVRTYKPSNKSTNSVSKDSTRAITVTWHKPNEAGAFEKHDWIEGDETICGSHLMVFPECTQLAFCIELTVFGGSNEELEWNAETIVYNEEAIKNVKHNGG